MPAFAPSPMLAQLERTLPRGDVWRYEPKLDGFRGLLWRRAGTVIQLLSRNVKDLSPWFPELIQAGRALPPNTVLDGEIRLDELADLIRRKNAIDADIANIVGRPAQMGHVGEYVAAEIFGILLEHSASTRSIDGYFATAPLAGRSVNIKWYGKQEGLLDLARDYTPDYYLVLTGPRGPAMSSRGGVRPWLISHVFLFESTNLYEALGRTGSKIGVATSVRAHLWAEAELFPEQRNPAWPLTSDQLHALVMFS